MCWHNADGKRQGIGRCDAQPGGLLLDQPKAVGAVSTRRLRRREESGRNALCGLPAGQEGSVQDGQGVRTQRRNLQQGDEDILLAFGVMINLGGAAAAAAADDTAAVDRQQLAVRRLRLV